MTLKSRAVKALTLARTMPFEYQVTYWNDGIARFDGESGPRQGAWQADIDPVWFTRAATLARSLQPGRVQDSRMSATLVLDTSDNRISFEASDTNEPTAFWMLSTLIDGMCQRTPWIPHDISGTNDLTPFAAGTPLWMSAGDATATGFGLNGSMLVLAGAHASTSTNPSLRDPYRQIRSELIDTGALALTEDRFRLTRHLLVSSPSGAASVLVGSNTSGRRAWRDARGRAWSELDLDY